MLLGIILFSLSKGFSSICRMWSFPITHVIILWGERNGLSFWVGVRDLGVSLGLLLHWAGEWACTSIFQTLSIFISYYPNFVVHLYLFIDINKPISQYISFVFVHRHK